MSLDTTIKQLEIIIVDELEASPQQERRVEFSELLSIVISARKIFEDGGFIIADDMLNVAAQRINFLMDNKELPINI